ncbi:MAG TPA: histidinol dehydrogenase [Usitatibacteraceae bacterium]|nr:histidinol dehydrogenase [Usitatibacteraceae bacterium]
MLIRRLKTSQPDFESQLDGLLAFESTQDESIDAAVRAIIAAVRARGDAALLELTARFDRWTPASAHALEVPKAELRRALQQIPADLRDALETAHRRLLAYHERQRLGDWDMADADGNVLGQRVTPLDRVGLYVPGGKAAYPSSVMMNAVAAKVAGVGELIMVTPTPDGIVNPAVLAAAALAGVDRVFRIGGAQAVAALAFGTASIPAVDKIVGPGNAYVAAAKRHVFGVVGIDMVAGPSEILVIADRSANADWLAADLFSQAEHDEIAQAILLCPDAATIDRVEQAMSHLLGHMPRAAIIRASLANRGALIQVRDLEEAAELANRIAPEHLELALGDPDALLPKLRHAGAIFVGHFASESLGDYCAGPNHVLPTARTARFSSALGVYDFQKRSSLIRISAAGARAIGPVAATLARAEGLEAHARSAEARLGSVPDA